MLEVVQDRDLLRQRVEGAEAPGLEQTRELTGNDRNHSFGENIRRAFGFRTWANVLEDLERMDHPAIEDGSHPIIHHPRAFLDHLVHVDDMDKLRLEHDDLSGSRSRGRSSSSGCRSGPASSETSGTVGPIGGRSGRRVRASPP